MKIFGNYGSEELFQKGYVTIGIPALLVEHPRTVKSEQLRDAIRETNGEILYDAIAHYWKTDADFDSPKSRGHAQIIGNAGGKHFLIVHALKCI